MSLRDLFSADYPEGISAEQFRSMSRDEQSDVMEEWFYRNYEDPANQTPHDAEDGYIFVWGGPYDAHEQLSDMFSDLASEELIMDVADAIVDAEGVVDWAPVNHDYEPDMEEEDDELTDPAVFYDQPNNLLNSAEDLNARGKIAETLNALEAMLVATKSTGSRLIGHNRPPEPIEGVRPVNADALLGLVHDLRAQIASNTPNLQKVKSRASILRNILTEAREFAVKVKDKASDRAAERVIDAAILGGVMYGPDFVHAVASAFQSLIAWLELIAAPIF